VENAPVCGAKRNNGELCTVRVRVAGERCWGHDPKNVEQRKQNARRAAQLKAQKPSELVEIKNTLRQLADDVLAGEVNRGDASVAAQVFGVLIRAHEQHRKQRELEEVVQRLERIEEVQRRRENVRPV